MPIATQTTSEAKIKTVAIDRVADDEDEPQVGECRADLANRRDGEALVGGRDVAEGLRACEIRAVSLEGLALGDVPVVQLLEGCETNLRVPHEHLVEPGRPGLLGADPEKAQHDSRVPLAPALDPRGCRSHEAHARALARHGSTDARISSGE